MIYSHALAVAAAGFASGASVMALIIIIIRKDRLASFRFREAMVKKQQKAANQMLLECFALLEALYAAGYEGPAEVAAVQEAMVQAEMTRIVLQAFMDSQERSPARRRWKIFTTRSPAGYIHPYARKDH